MAKPDAYDTGNPYAQWNCIVCGCLVVAEPLYDQHHRIRGYAPASRYWHDEGVLCGANCSLAHYERARTDARHPASAA